MARPSLSFLAVGRRAALGALVAPVVSVASAVSAEEEAPKKKKERPRLAKRGGVFVGKKIDQNKKVVVFLC